MVKFLDLQKINARFEDEFSSSFRSFLDLGRYVNGDEVKRFEERYADFCGTKYGIGVANGLDALTLIFKGFIQTKKLKKGDEVIVPANTFIATVLSVVNAGLKPVFVEPDETTFNISPSEIEKHITAKTKAILVVHLYGQLADMEAINITAKNNNLIVVEDAAQAHGATATTSGKRAGNLSKAAAFSFYPSKNLGALGDAGAITTSDVELANCVRLLHNYGSSKKYTNDTIGFNSRLDELQAFFLNTKLRSLDDDNAKRRAIARQYLSQINNNKISLPFYDGTDNHVFYAFVVRVSKRERFTHYLQSNSIGYLIHYPVAPHKQKAFSNFNHLNLPLTESIHESVVSIPISPVMDNDEVGRVIDVINKY
jgi:dTDP-4-amino-4,6-dideoxygalactose transaminase